MRVLYFTTRECWPVTTGAHLRDFHLARELALEHEVVYLGFTTGEGRPAGDVWRERLKELGGAETVLVRRKSGYAPVDLIKGYSGPEPISVLNYTTGRMRAELDRVLREREFDAVQIEGVHMSGYLKQIRETVPCSAIVGDWHNIESELMARYAGNTAEVFKRMYARRTTALLRHAETRFLALCAAHTVCSERERTQLLARAPETRIEVIGNGVDVKFYGETAAEGGERNTLVFVGSMSYHANIDAALYFAREIWPAVRTARPDLRFVVVGSRPAPEILALREREGIRVTGTVDDIRPYYRQALAVVVPLRVGSGTRLKVLEAMASGTPVISTTLGAEGLAVTAGKDILFADSPHEFAATAALMQEHSVEWRKLAENGRRLVEARYDWPAIGNKLRRFHAELSEASRGAASSAPEQPPASGHNRL